MEEIGDDLFCLKSVMDGTREVISKTCYKDQRGDYFKPETMDEIDEIGDSLQNLVECIKKIQEKIEVFSHNRLKPCVPLVPETQSLGPIPT